MAKGRGVDKDEEGSDPKHDSDHTFDQEDPTPALVAANPVHLGNSSGGHTRESAGECTETVEPRDARREISRHVPERAQIHCAGEKSSFKNSEQYCVVKVCQ